MEWKSGRTKEHPHQCPYFCYTHVANVSTNSPYNSTSWRTSLKLLRLWGVFHIQITEEQAINVYILHLKYFLMSYPMLCAI